MNDSPSVLATDLDGTLIPLQGNQNNLRDLRQLERELQAAKISLTFATGRHFESVRAAIDEFQLPSPDWIICDVGTSIYQRQATGKYAASAPYAQHLSEIVGDCSTQHLADLLQPVADLQLQETEKQTRFKLSYYVDSQSLPRSVAQIDSILRDHQLPYSLISSIDPFEHIGLVDLLPQHSSKAYALQWWSTSIQLKLHDIVYAGDSGNDAAALAAGYRAIVVGNAAPEVLASARRAHAAAGLTDRIYAASAPATSGVLEGLRHFLSATDQNPGKPTLALPRTE